MIPYTGKNSSKQAIRTKSIPLGYKIFLLYSADGYPYSITSLIDIVVLNMVDKKYRRTFVLDHLLIA